MSRFFLGVAADDFTGASDAASFLTAAGVPAVLIGQIPEGKDPQKIEFREGTKALVIALKSRTEPAAQAVEESLKAFAWLREAGCEKLYYKYCATFDSTDEGNIGPVTDAVMEAYGLTRTLLCPALPVNGRTLRDGCLYVNGRLLEESHMKDHPLTPMRKSRIRDLMAVQGKYPVWEMSLQELREAEPANLTRSAGEREYVVPEYYEEAHGDLIAEKFWDLPFFTGGSGLCGALGREYVRRQENVPGTPQEELPEGTSGKALLLAGSCSAVTLEQIRDYRDKGYDCLRIRPERLMEGSQTDADIWAFIDSHGKDGSEVLIYSSAAPEELRESQKCGADKVAALLEEETSALALKAAEKGYTRLIIAGGETSGAVTKALGFSAFYIGRSVAPGVPIMTPVENENFRLVLKSGGFGGPDFFEKAVRMTEEG